MRKLFSLFLLLGAAVVLSAEAAWALPWEGWVTCRQDFSQEMTLGRTLNFHYQSVNSINLGDNAQPGDILRVTTADGVLIGQLTESDGTYPDWKSVTMQVPDGLVFTEQKLVFSTIDVGARTDPHWVFNAINSPVPEPATLLLLGSGLLGLTALRRKKG